MRASFLPRAFLFAAVALGVALAVAGTAQAQSSDWPAVEKALGRAGTEQDGVYRVTFPRTDLRVHVGGVSVRAGLALTSWAAFEKTGSLTTMMGDLVLLTGELDGVVTKLSKANIDVTAIHNHLVGELPRLVYVHYHGEGGAAELAAALRGALASTGTPLGAPRAPRTEEGAGLDAAELGRILAHTGTASGGVVSFSIPRAEQIKCCGAENDPLLIVSGIPVGPRMGAASSINFQAEGSGAVVAGDLVLVAGEVPLVVRTLREYGIEIVALHSHMLDEQPRLLFLHFWGRGDARPLAGGLRAALERTNHTRLR
jgi:hypothetical protein